MDLISDLSPASLLLWGTSIVLVVLYVVKNFILGGTKSSQIVPDKVKPEAVDDPSKPKLFILFGSQTGTAEGFSKVLAQEAGDIGFNVQMLNLADIMSPEQELAEMPFVIFVAATYGEGEPTDDARDFYEWLGNSSLSNDVLSGTKFTVFSLGNKQYKHYQAVGRLIDKRIEELGAQRIYKRGEGNADENIEEDFEDWKATLWTDVAKEFGLNPDFEKPIVKQYEITYFDKVNVKLCPFIDEAKGTGEDAKRPFLCKVSECRELLKGQDPNDKTMRSTVHVEVDITGSKMRYEAGDHIGVFAHNPAELVQQYVERLGVASKMDTAFILKHINGTSGSVFPNRCTMRTAFTYYLELGAAPRKPLLRAFAKYATDEKERERLEVLAKNDDEGKQEYHQYIKVNYLTPLDVLLDFPSVHIPVEHFFELVPRLQPRYYSIGSSSKMHPHSIHIVASVVKYQTPKGKVRTGLCSSFLAQSKPGDRIYAFVRSSTFHLPLNTQIPVVMVGPGTGIAPFMGFLQQRRALKEKQNKVLGDAHLFFGCRKRLEDYVYSDVMQESLESGVISHLHVAFSREQAQKDYVQHHLERNAEAVWKVISSGGCFYVCGDAKFMSKDVDRALLSIVQKFNNCGVEEAEAYLEKLLQDKKLFRDVWSPSA